MTFTTLRISGFTYQELRDRLDLTGISAQIKSGRNYFTLKVRPDDSELIKTWNGEISHTLDGLSIISVYIQPPTGSLTLAQAKIYLTYFEGCQIKLRLTETNLTNFNVDNFDYSVSPVDRLVTFTKIDVLKRYVNVKWPHYLKTHINFPDPHQIRFRLPSFGERSERSELSPLLANLIETHPSTPKGWKVIGTNVWRFPPSGIRDLIDVFVNEGEGDDRVDRGEVEDPVAVKKSLVNMGCKIKNLFNAKVPSKLIKGEDFSKIDWVQWGMDTLEMGV